MKIRISLLIAIACCLLLVSSGVQAAGVQDLYSQEESTDGNYVKFNRVKTFEREIHVPLPDPGEDEVRLSVPGPMSVMDASSTRPRGSAIVGPKGGSFMTPRREADREIQRLIKILD
jgi:hypothetical protein